MIVLSLFDGMSCGQIALRELGVTIDTYYASEVDKFAIANTMANFPDTVQLGDVRDIDAKALGHIDLLIGGSPCQSFSFVGKRAGMSTKTNEKILTLPRYMELKAQGFEFEGQSYLFWEYVRILHEVRQTNPSVYFMLENVEMGKQWETVINEALGVRGVHISSALVSAQVRKRIYWTNIKTFQTDMFGPPDSAIPQPRDRGILLRDILEDQVEDRYYLKPDIVKNLLTHKERNQAKGNGFGAVFHEGGGKMGALKVGGHGVDDLVAIYNHTDIRIRRLTPVECARLQTIPDWYKWEVSETQQYKMLGNGWTVEVIKHIFSFLPDNLKK